MRHLTSTLLIMAALLGVAGPSAVYAQTAAATLSGTVTDSSGAVVPGVTVTVTNTATGLKQTATGNRGGLFTIPLLPPGDYTLSAQHPGFAPVEMRNIILQVGSRLALEVKLQLGEVKESVTVSADAGQIQLKTESGERSEIITSRQIKDLQLNGRNTIDLLKIVPGMVVTQDAGWGNFIVNGTRAWSAVSANGTRATMKEMLLDGSDNVNTGPNNTLNVSVNPDALAEVKVLTSNFQAEYGKAGGAVVQMTTRSGTSQFHGVARYVRRDGGLNANNFFNNAQSLSRPVYRYGYYGYSVGGPVIIPGTRFNKSRNKLFFFWDQEIDPQRVPPAATSIQMPTAAERNGDFSKSTNGNGAPIVVRDPLTGVPFAGNVIPQSRLYQYGPNILSIFPLPNTSTGGPRYNYVSQVSNPFTTRGYLLRIDYNINEKTRLTGRWARNSTPGMSAYGGNYFNIAYNFPLANHGQILPPVNLTFTLTRTFTPTLTNELIFGFTRNDNKTAPASPSLLRSTYGIDFPLFFPKAAGSDFLPSFQFGGIANQPPPTMTIYALPRRNLNATWNLIDNVMKVTSAHMFKVGIFVERGLMRNLPAANVNPTISFGNDANNPLNTGDPYANALLGIYTSYSQANANLEAYVQFKNIEGYLQDTWKVTRHLTLDLGLRISWIPPQYDSRLQGNYFVPSFYDGSRAVRLYTPVLVNGQRRAIDAANRPGVLTPQNTLPSGYIGLIVPSSGDPYNGIQQARNGYFPGGFEDRGAQWGPRFGFAYDFNGKLVVRGGYGISYDRVQANVASAQVNTPPAVQSPQLLYGYLRDLSGGTGYLAPPSLITLAPDGKVPNVHSFNFGVQRSIGLGTIIDAAYVGTLGRHLFQSVNINAVPYFTTFQRSAQDPSLYQGGVVPNVEGNLPAAYSRAGLSFTGANALPANFLRPYPGYGDINYRQPTGSSNYHALQVAVKRSFGRSLTFGLAYTYSKAMDTGDADFDSNNPYDTRRYDYQVASFDRTHVLVVNYVYDLPKIATHLGSGRVARAILNDWHVSGVSQYSTGAPLELGMSIQGINAGQRILGTYSVQPLLYRAGGSTGAPDSLHINPDAYYVPNIADVGPYPRAYLRQPSWMNHDISVSKSIPLGSDRARYLQIRLEMFNAFNHTEFVRINSGVQLATASGSIGNAVFSDYPNVKITNNLRPASSPAPLGQFFGEYNASRDSRIIQLGVKIYF